MTSSRLFVTAAATALAAAVSMPAPAAALPRGGPQVMQGHMRHVDGHQPVRDSRGRMLYTVLMKDPAVALYHGAVEAVDGFQPLFGVPGADGKLNLRTPAAKAYARHLASEQDRLLATMRASGMAVQVVSSYQYALNGFSAWMTQSTAKRVAHMQGVESVHMVVRRKPMADRSLDLIGAPEVWFNDPSASHDRLFAGDFDGGEPGNRGAGVVVADLDTGINFPNHAYDDDGITNPLGDGNFLGWCNNGYATDKGQTAADPCNNKIIGSYDFVYPVLSDPGAVGEYAGAMDEGDHGSHTSSTAAGSRRAATFMGNRLTLSGVAPEANIIMYDVCAPEPANCPTVSTSAAVEQAIKDGVVDVLNYSIGGGGMPWDYPTAKAFLSATESGIFVAAAAGNSGPGPGTTGHLGPWVTTVAATTTDRLGFDWTMSLPGGSVTMLLGSLGTSPASSTTPAGTELTLSPDFATASDGCGTSNPYSSNYFQGDIALLKRGSCSFSTKAAHAVASGAVMVIIANNAGGDAGLAPAGTPKATVPVFGITQDDGQALEQLLSTSGGAVAANLIYPAVPYSFTADAVVGFSSRGPGHVNLLKPEVAAPGVQILSAFGGGPNGDPEALGLLSGTSMAAPHVTGAAALMTAAHPHWSPMQIKSALMLTAKPANQLLAISGIVTTATPLDAGAGRIRVDQAVKSGLVMDESGFRMWNANPAKGGDPSQLNLASIYQNNCIIECSLERTVASTLAGDQTWDIATSGLDAPLTVSLSSPSLTLSGPGDRSSFEVTVDASAAQDADVGFHYGTLTLTNSGNPGTPVLHMPIAIKVPPAIINTDAAQLSFTATAGGTATTDLKITNVGGVPLNWSADTATTDAAFTLIDNAPTPSGYIGSEFSVPAPNFSTYQAEDFISPGVPVTVKALTARGFVYNGPSLPASATSMTFVIYADASGVPAGLPTDAGATPVYQCTLQMADVGANNGLSFIDAGSVRLNLATAASFESSCAVPTLNPGQRYWLSVYATMPNGWNGGAGTAWIPFIASEGSGLEPTMLTPGRGVTAWAPISAVFSLPSPEKGLAVAVDAGVACGASWLSVTAPAGGAGTVTAGGGTSTVTYSVDASGFAAGSTHQAFACISSNAANDPMTVIPVTVTVN